MFTKIAREIDSIKRVKVPSFFQNIVNKFKAPKKYKLLNKFQIQLDKELDLEKIIRRVRLLVFTCMGISVRPHTRLKLQGATSFYDEGSKYAKLKLQDANVSIWKERIANYKKMLKKFKRKPRTLNRANFRVCFYTPRSSGHQQMERNGHALN